MHRITRIVIGFLAVAAIGLVGCGPENQNTAKVLPPESASPEAADTFLPTRFTITYRPPEPVAYECGRTGDSVTCTPPGDTLAEGFISWTATIIGPLSGPTMTGTATTDIEAHKKGHPDCISHQHSSGPVSYTFRPDGTVAIRDGPTQWQTTYSGNCPDQPTVPVETVPLWEGTGAWTASDTAGHPG